MNKNQGEFGKDEDITEDIQEWLIYQTSWPIKGSILVEIKTKIIRYRFYYCQFFIAKLLIWKLNWHIDQMTDLEGTVTNFWTNIFRHQQTGLSWLTGQKSIFLA